MAVMIRKLLAAVVGVVVAWMATAAQAAMVTTSQADFNAAVASLTLQWSEDFESFTPGALPDAPVSIGSGAFLDEQRTKRIIDTGGDDRTCTSGRVPDHVGKEVLVGNDLDLT
jgi:ABC-type phosphate transport system substrate-binding protein